MDTPASGLVSNPDAPVSTPQILWVIRVLALGAAGVAGYLAVTSFLLKGLPIGCGSGSGCDEVLQSKWSALFGIPVGFFALGAYLAVFGATYFVRTGALLLGLTMAITASAVWFIVLQALVLDAFCLWCLADHALGLAMAFTSFAYVARLADDDGATGPTDASRRAVLGGIGLAAALIVMQVIWGESAAELARLPGSEDTDTGPGPDRRISVLNGKFQIDVHEAPILGSPDAESLIVILFDYCCPHCRQTHEYLVEGFQRYPGQYGVVLLPTPLDEDCNRSILPEETDERFKDACELAGLALAVWRADREKFPVFDAWLYEPETPRTEAEARAEAESLVGREALEEALADDWIRGRIAADVDAYLESTVQQIPIVLSPGMDAVVGRAESADELFEILERELGLTSPDES